MSGRMRRNNGNGLSSAEPTMQQISTPHTNGDRVGPFSAIRRGFNNRSFTPFRDLRDRYSDSSSGETLTGDALEALRQPLGILPPRGFKSDYAHRIGARANVLDAISIYLDAVEAEGEVEKIHKLRIALGKINKAQEHGWATVSPIGKRREYYVITKTLRTLIEDRLQQLNRALAQDTVNSSTAPMTIEDVKGMEDLENGVDSPEARSFFLERVKEKRVKNWTYMFRTGVTSLVTGGIYTVSLYTPSSVTEIVRGVAGAAGLVALYQLKGTYSEFVKRRAAEEGREYSFGIPKNDLEGRKDTFRELSQVIARTTEGNEITNGHILDILVAFADASPRMRRHYMKVIGHIQNQDITQ